MVCLFFSRNLRVPTELETEGSTDVDFSRSVVSDSLRCRSVKFCGAFFSLCGNVFTHRHLLTCPKDCVS